MTPAQARQFIERMGGCRVAVIGDLMLDRYSTGTATRISPEAPVPIVRLRHQRTTLGGAANVVLNLITLGVQAHAFGIVGDDDNGSELRALCAQRGIQGDGVLSVPGRKTTVKTRLIANQQQIARIDDEDDTPVREDGRAQLLERLETAIRNGQVQAVIIEDYNKGVVSSAMARRIQELADRYHLVTALDPHPGNLLDFRGVTLMTPNRQEAFGMAGVYYRPTVLPLTDDAALLSVGRIVREKYAPRILLVTLGADGMASFQGDEPPRHIPTVAREVFDVSGAGDTVIATFTAALLAGADAAESATLANHAAGIVVGKMGTCPVPRHELLASFVES